MCFRTVRLRGVLRGVMTMCPETILARDGPSLPCQYVCEGGCTPAVQIDRRTGPHHLHVRITLPGNSNGITNRGSFAGPFPVVCFFNGFEARMSHYRMYATHLASWGFAVVQYETAILSLLSDQKELPFLGEVLAMVREAAAKPSDALHGKVDLDNLAVAGHSRGGKLAALHFARSPEIKACYLLDGVDNTKYAPESAAHPSGSKEVERAGRPLGMAAAQKIGSCNPEGSNAHAMWPRMPAGSGLTVVEGASHTSFLDAGFLLNSVFDALCCRGRRSRKGVFQLTVPGVLAWMEMYLRPNDPDVKARVEEYRAWRAEQVAAGTLTWTQQLGSESMDPEKSDQLAYTPDLQGGLPLDQLSKSMQPCEEANAAQR